MLHSIPRNMQDEIDAAIELQRAQMQSEVQAELEREKQAWYSQNHEREIERDRLVNSLRLRLGLTQTSVCRLLVDQTQTRDYELSKRMQTPPKALHSLVARARASESRGRP